mgnify:CR=1 FL=1
MTEELNLFIKQRRKQLNFTQEDLARRAGVGLRFIQELGQGKESLRLDRVNRVLALFGHKMASVKNRGSE